MVRAWRACAAIVVLLLCLPAGRAALAQSDAAFFDQAEAASTGRDLGKARDLYKQAAERDPDPRRRNRAMIRAGSLEWHVFHNAEAARTLLARVPDDSREATVAWVERAYMELALARDVGAAREAARVGRSHARTLADRESAAIADVTVVASEAREQRLKGTCPNDRAALGAVMTNVGLVIDAGGPVLETSRRLLNLALMTGDRATVARAWRWYFGDVPASPPAETADRRSLALALASAKLFPEAELVLRNPCDTESVEQDGAVRDVLAYTATLDRLDRLIREQHRSVARGVEDDSEFQKAVAAESRSLWNALAWPGPTPEFSVKAFNDETARRFGTVTSLGRTDGVLSLLFGHAVVDERRTVEQYGRSAPVRFVLLDGMLSGGYVVWATRGRSGTGGWITTDAIYQIRQMYADGPVRIWRRMTDLELRAQREQDITDETRRDAERAKQTPIQYFPGLALRLEHQAADALRAELLGQGLSGDALRDAFLRRTSLDKFESSIWAHEGRHAIDKLIFKINDSVELEYRAKMSEAVFARRPRGVLSSLLSPVGPPSAHGRANQRLLEGIVAWMKEHAAEIAGLVPQSPLLPQLDKLSDDQLRAAFRSMDPLAK